MKRSNTTIYIVFLLLFAAVASYLGLSLYRSLSNPFKTTPASVCSIEEKYSVNGILVRDEAPLYTDDKVIDVTAEDGGKLGKNEAVAAAYSDEASIAKNARLGELKRRIELFKEAGEGDVSAAALDRADEKIASVLFKLSSCVQKNDFSKLDKLSAELKSLVFKREYHEDSAKILAEIGALEDEYEAAAASVEQPRYIYTSESGVFYSQTDGYEGLAPDRLENITPDGVLSLVDGYSRQADGAFGKLVRSIYWYYAAVADAEDAKSLREALGDAKAAGASASVRLRFGGDAGSEYIMALESVSEPSDGKCAVVFSSKYDLESTLDMRRQSAEIIRNTYEGLRVPKKAIHISGDGPCVFVVYGLQARQTGVKILYEGDDYYIVENDRADPDALAADDEIIVSAYDLYDGKVIG